MEFNVEQVENEILAYLKNYFGMDLKESQPVNRGYRNYKWILSTKDGARYFAKHYHPARFTVTKLEEVKKTLYIQDQLNQQGITCPKPYSKDGEYIHETPLGIHFVLMEHSDGMLVEPGKINHDQVYHLGKMIGHMHYILSQLPEGNLDWKPNQVEMFNKWSQQWELVQNDSSQKAIYALEKQRIIIDSLHLENFENCKQGYAHWDLWVDNLLFYPNKVAAILDFDRMRFVFPELDIARVILSGTYSVESGMDWDAIRLFLKGYRKFLPFSAQQLARAFRLSWCQESVWWFTHDIEVRDANPKRFFEEMLWITENWNCLNDMIEEHLT